MLRARAIAASVVLVAALAAPLTSATASTSAPAPTATSTATAASTAVGDRLVPMTLSSSAFSPNGDGRKDTVRVRYRLPAPARVTVLVRRGGDRVVQRARLGHQPRGRGSYVLDGTAGHKVLRDGSYDVKVVAVSGGRRSHSRAVPLRLARTIEIGIVRRDWPTVHPRTPGLVDTVVIEYLVPVFGTGVAGGRFEVVDPDGDVVASWGRSAQEDTCEVVDAETFCGTSVAWDGRLDGRSLPGGEYTVVFTARDGAGNLARRRLPVEVSDEALVERRTSVVVPAALAVPPPEPDTGCNGCGEEIGGQCGTVTAPGRLGPESLRYASRDTCDTTFLPFGKAQAAREHAVQMVAAAAYGPRSVTARGGPSLPGGASVGHLLVDGVDTILTGDGEGVSQEMATPRPGSSDRWVEWRFETRGTDSYDVAWFRVDHTYYVAP